MSRITQEIWERLEISPPVGESLTARPAMPDITHRLLAGIDVDGRRHLLVPLHDIEAGLRDSHSRGLEVITRELVVAGQPAARHLDIACQDVAGHEAFDLIGEELAKRLATGTETPDKCIARVLAKWRRFWGHLPSQMLSSEEQTGLFAELWFLIVWLFPRVGGWEAVTRWRGPFQARHDFEWPGRSVEVKGTTSTRGTIHRIHGIEQLAPPENGDLLFFSLRLRDEAGASNTLPGLVALCMQQLGSNDDAASRFQVAMVKAGYSSVHEEEYAKRRLRVVEQGLFAVAQDFPRLTHAELAAGLPVGVEYVEYDINLAGFEHLRVAKTPTETFAL